MAGVLGVDFGTSHTAAVLRRADGVAQPVLFDGSPVLSSAVFVDGTTRIAGRDAAHRGLSHPERFEPHPKRRIDDGTVLLGDDEVPVAELIAVVLRRVRAEAEAVAGGPVDGLVLTCPAGWGAPRRSTLRDAARLADLPVPAFVAEPVAAAAYARTSPDGPTLVYDLGAGTFDASVVRSTAGGVEVMASRGRDDTGGLDVDAAIVASLAATVGAGSSAWQRMSAPATPADRRARTTLWTSAREAKEHLTRTASTFVFVPLLEVEAPVGREQLDVLAAPVLARTMETVRDVLAVASVRPAAVVLVGGASRIPLVATMLHRELGVTPRLVDQPELAVAYGSVAADVHGDGSAAEPVSEPVSEAVEPAAGGRRRWLVATAILAVLLVAGVVGALVALPALTDRPDGVGAGLGGSSAPAAASRGPFDLELAFTRGRRCYLSRGTAPNEQAIALDLPLTLAWKSGTPAAPPRVILTLSSTGYLWRGIAGEFSFETREGNLVRSASGTNQTLPDTDRAGYHRLWLDDAARGVTIRVRSSLNTDAANDEPDTSNNEVFVAVPVPVQVGTAAASVVCS